MTLTTIPAIATGDVWTAAQWTTYLRSNVNDQNDFANGVQPFVGTVQKFANDANLLITKASGNPYLQFDSGDYLFYDRTGNGYGFYVGNTEIFRVDATGKIQTALIETSEATITNGSTGNLAHGLGATPRLVFARYNTVTGDAGRTRVVVPSYVAIASTARIEQVGATNIVIINNTGATIFAKAWALL